MNGEEESNLFTELESSEFTLFDLSGTVEEANTNFLVESSKYRKLPTQNSLQRVIQAAAYKEITLANIIDYIYSIDADQYAIEDRAKTILAILLDDDKARIAGLGELTSAEAYTPAIISEEEFTETILELDENDIDENDIVSAIMTIYQKNSESDIVCFVNEVSKTKNATAVRLGKQIGHIAIDFGKYSAAAAFGAWVATKKLK